MSVRDQGGKLVLDIDHSMIKTYLKLLTEGCLATEKNGSGSERRVIWDYLQKKYLN